MLKSRGKHNKRTSYLSRTQAAVEVSTIANTKEAMIIIRWHYAQSRQFNTGLYIFMRVLCVFDGGAQSRSHGLCSLIPLSGLVSVAGTRPTSRSFTKGKDLEGSVIGRVSDPAMSIVADPEMSFYPYY